MVSDTPARSLPPPAAAMPPPRSPPPSLAALPPLIAPRAMAAVPGRQWRSPVRFSSVVAGGGQGLDEARSLPLCSWLPPDGLVGLVSLRPAGLGGRDAAGAAAESPLLLLLLLLLLLMRALLVGFSPSSTVPIRLAPRASSRPAVLASCGDMSVTASDGRATAGLSPPIPGLSFLWPCRPFPVILSLPLPPTALRKMGWRITRGPAPFSSVAWYLS